MKKMFGVALLLLMMVGYVNAQQLEQHATIQRDQVPAVVLQKFEAEFGAIPEGGSWSVTYVRSDDGSALPTKPTQYTYRNRSKGEKIVVTFAPEGDVRYVKGLNRKNHYGSSESDNG